MAALSVSWPVRLGVVKEGGLEARLHRYTREKKLQKIELLLNKDVDRGGVDVDCVNDLGQTPLFCAALLAMTSVTELLLKYGANPNHRCEDRSTPMHAAVFSCKPWLLSGLLDAGGELRLHNNKGQSPQDWAKDQENSARMLEFLKSCTSHMQSLSQNPQPRMAHHTPCAKNLVRWPSLLEVLKSGGNLHLNRKTNSKSSLCDTVQCFGVGKLCIEKPGQALGLLASLPVIGDSELVQSEDEASFSCGSFITMTNYCWKGSWVTVKELQSPSSPEGGSVELQSLSSPEGGSVELQSLSSPEGGSVKPYLDLLLTEQEYCSQLFHPHLLQLMAVSMSSDMLGVRLVFERVHVGSLHTLLHQKRAEFPMLRVETLLSLVLQVCEGLLYLHSRALVMRALSSHTVIITHPGLAKLSGLGFTVPSEGSGSTPLAPLPLPPGAYNWAAPEVIRGKSCTGKADLYSLCALIQELYTGAVPWGPVDASCIRQAVESGHALVADPCVPQPFYNLVWWGLRPRPQDRTPSLDDLRCDIRAMVQVSGRRSDAYTETGGWFRPKSWSPELGLDTGEEGPSGSTVDTTLGHEEQAQLSLLDRETETEGERERVEERLQEEREGMTTDSESLLHRDISFRDILALDNRRPTPTAPSEPESAHEEESDSEERPEEDMIEKAAQLQWLNKKMSEHISSIVLNLKVSQVFLQQCESSAYAMEAARRRQPRSAEGSDEVDGEATRRDAPPSLAPSGSRAVGPPSQYRLLPHGIHPSAKRLEAQLLQGGMLALSEEELTEWRREYPAEELSVLYYSSAQEDSFVDVRPRNKQQAATGSPRGTERGEQPQSVTQRQSVNREEVTDRSCVSPEGSDSLEADSPTRQPKQSENEVMDLVDKVTRERWIVEPGPGQGWGLAQRAAEEEGQSDTELEKLIKWYQAEAAYPDHQGERGTRGVTAAAAGEEKEEEESKGSEQGSREGLDANPMEEVPQDYDLLDPEGELMSGGGEEEECEEELLDEEGLTNDDDEEEEEEPLDAEETTHSEAPVDTGAPVYQRLAKGLHGFPESLEETDGANSTLDEALQNMLMTRAAGGHRVLKSPGPVSHFKTLRSVCEPQAEAEVSKDAGCPGGDSAESVERKVGDPADIVPAELEMASHGTWNQPHRVIRLEYTPIKSQSGPNQVERE